MCWSLPAWGLKRRGPSPRWRRRLGRAMRDRPRRDATPPMLHRSPTCHNIHSILVVARWSKFTHNSISFELFFFIIIHIQQDHRQYKYILCLATNTRWYICMCCTHVCQTDGSEWDVIFINYLDFFFNYENISFL